MTDPEHDLSELTHPPHHRAEIVFAVVSFLIAVALALAWSTETQWIDGQAWSRQPGLWPLIAVVGMLVFGIGELVACLIRNLRNGGGDVLAEVALWARAGEYLAWFLVYVLATPWIGYLPATAIFMTALAWRLGYRGRSLALAPLVAVVIVVMFKAVLAVRIPGGAIYDVFPQAVRNFLVIYL
ncbi:MAG: tripartite tricarboxylate transporter TctB family protein [Rhodobacter sp.]|uniref:tripartite tricarboxylate transporter TctB family protein n=1 Tax=Pararhodobacter sp. TaxID=2127056 RepID=UPI001E1868C7|nr:tripartite tricarboxylate transporter TctB family protein [Pararhodobacter sp.]MCB1345943.1 tripartite tricarboxylate transporter TctB family protein [Paracoccaceae bacterium]MCC0072897.1 tripartite tricarboxylate transporter TctB family protein [Rhodobacter sp.]HPD92932.1 tripartite tricarboxylate transporter TctB family protein [Pararhodobacter sp.]